MKIDLDIYDQIRKMFESEGCSQREIARRLNISRNTVAKYCNGNHVPWVRKPYSDRTNKVVSDDVIHFIKSCLQQDEVEGIKKQKHTAARIYHRLVDEMDFTGGESTIRRVVRELRSLENKAYIPLSFDPGEAAQVDWGSAWIYYQGKKVKVKIFCVRLCHSASFHVRAFFAENEECFLEGHIHAFEFFSGVPRKIVFDNAKVAVREGLGAYVTKENPRYKALKAHYAFETAYCNPSSGHEKGLVEGLVGFIRRNAFVPMPRVNSLDELNTLLTHRCREYLKHRIRGEKESVGEKFLLDKQSLRPLPPYIFDVSQSIYTRVNTMCQVIYQTNRYSVPCHYVGKEVTIKAKGAVVEIYYKGSLIACHDRCYDSHQKIYELAHYMPLIEKRPRSVFNAEPVKNHIPSEVLDAFMKLPEGHKKAVEFLKESFSSVNESTHQTGDIASAPIPLKGPAVKKVDLSIYDQLIREVSRA
ncbi:MAG: transposase [Anaerosolibacter sp.]|uniref:IS21 family transposase n=1 Tax=Anaerosolibacter sp. TaxID=1872527 RepID=UPI0026203EC0|nr:IS21 family transposase [Anaerosolibacter sp.]MDF2545786.1 transposase [Anaerosolibacter sp.]